jgi:hypothetical protein
VGARGLVCTLSGGLWPVRMRWPAARTPGCGFGGGVQRPVPAVALPLCGIGGATASLLVCRAAALREHRVLRARPAARWLHPASHPQASGAAATRPRSRPRHPTRSRRTGRATGMNRDDCPRQYPTLSLVDNAPQTWDRGPSCSAHPMLHLLPYPRPRRQGRAVPRSHIGSGSVPDARRKQPKPRQSTA